MLDVTDATFQREVVEESTTRPVVVDLWAPWCGPCRQLGPVLDAAITATNGAVKGVKVNVDENPAVSQAFSVQSIPAVYVLRDGKVVDGFMGARGAADVEDFLARIQREHGAVASDAEGADDGSVADAATADAEAPAPETADSVAVPADIEDQLAQLLPQVKADDEARAAFVALLDLMGPGDPRTAGWRKRLTTALF